MLKRLGISLAALVAAAGLAFGAGQFTNFPIVGGASYCASTANGVCQVTVPAGPSVVTGLELVPADTQIAGGGPSQSVLLTMSKMNALPYQYAAPLTGTTVAVAPTTGSMVIDPAGTIAALTLTLPAATALTDGQQLAISSSQTVTALTITPGSGTTVSNSPTAITISTTATYGYKFVYNATLAKWYRLL